VDKKVLVVGGGGREHALVWKLAQSSHVGKIYVAPGNAGTEAIAENVPIGFTDTENLLKFAQENKIDLTVIGQEAASEAGVVDAFKKAGLITFGPTKAATRIESSKAFSKDLMAAQKIPTAHYKKFESANEALAYLDNQKFPLVIKASGLAEGKGAVVCESLDQAKQTIDDMMVKKVFKDAGNTVVIEDFLSGQEVSTHALCDGKTAILFPASQDHKQVYDGDKGPNTGGLGVIAPLPWITKEHIKLIEQKIVKPALQGLVDKGSPFTGCLYPGLMIDGDDINVIEFNARFGDPEAEVYMRLLESDLFEILDSCARGQLDASKVIWRAGFAISVALCSGGYPGKYKKGLSILGLEKAERLDDIVIFHAGTTKDETGYKTAGGRVLHVTATGNSIEEARAKVYEAIKLVHFDGMQYRADIGARSL
jgi:phosphoribosylamine--glycine ligase